MPLITTTADDDTRRKIAQSDVTAATVSREIAHYAFEAEHDDLIGRA